MSRPSDELGWLPNKRPSPHRPLCVAFISVFEIAKAGILLLVAAFTWNNPERFEAFGNMMPLIIYIAARGNPRGFLELFVAAYLMIVGWGLWRLKRWARNLLLASSALMVVRWARYFMIAWALEGERIDSKARQAISFMILIDALVFAYLAFYDGVPQAFGEKA